jgi:hypothetical protein
MSRTARPRQRGDPKNTNRTMVTSMMQHVNNFEQTNFELRTKCIRGHQPHCCLKI